MAERRAAVAGAAWGARGGAWKNEATKKRGRVEAPTRREWTRRLAELRGGGGVSEAQWDV
jgi:hypothetical protein